MTRSVWLKADSTVGDWETRKKRITAGLESGVDWVLVDEGDVGRVRELGDVKVAAFLQDQFQFHLPGELSGFVVCNTIGVPLLEPVLTV